MVLIETSLIFIDITLKKYLKIVILTCFNGCMIAGSRRGGVADHEMWTQKGGAPKSPETANCFLKPMVTKLQYVTISPNPSKP